MKSFFVAALLLLPHFGWSQYTYKNNISYAFYSLLDQDKTQQYLREAEYYNKKAEMYERDAAYYTKKAESYMRQADYYSRKKNSSRAQVYTRYAKDALSKANLRLKWANDAREKAQLRLSWAKRARIALWHIDTGIWKSSETVCFFKKYLEVMSFIRTFAA